MTIIYFVTLFITIIIVNSLVSWERHFTFEVYRKVVFISIVFNSTYNVFMCGEGGLISAVFPAGLAPCCREGPQKTRLILNIFKSKQVGDRSYRNMKIAP